jgi:hypothetical protein
VRHDCDSEVAGLLDGTLASGDLAHKFADADGNRRGIHEGTFRWTGAGTASVAGATDASPPWVMPMIVTSCYYAP